MLIICIAEPPEWVKLGAEIDMFDKNESVYYNSIIKWVARGGNEIMLMINYPGYHVEQCTLANGKYTPMTSSTSDPSLILVIYK